MIFKNAFHLLIDNFKLNFKFLLYKIIVAVITIALCAAFVYPTLHMIFSSDAFKSLLELFGDFFKALISGDVEFLRTFTENLQEQASAFLTFLQDKTPNVVFFAVALVLIMLISRFLGGIGNFVFGKLIDDKMSSYAKTSFSSAFISNLGKGALWQLVYVPLTFIYDVCVLALCFLVFLLLLNVIAVGFVASIAALMVSVALLLCSQAVKLTLFSNVVPSMVADKSNLRTVMKKSFSFDKERFGTLFCNYLATSVLIWCINVLFAVVSFGAALLITIPMSYLMLICIQFVSYYSYGKKKYFLTKDQIVAPKEEKNEENFYDDFEL